MEKGKIIGKIFIVTVWSILIISVFQLSMRVRAINNFDLQKLERELDKFSGREYFKEVNYSENGKVFIKHPRYCGKEVFEFSTNGSAEDKIYLYGGSSVVHPKCEKEKIPYYLENILNEEYSEDKRIYNFGKPGANLGDIKKSLRINLEVQEPEMILIYSGHNNYIKTHRAKLRKEMNLFYEENILWHIYEGITYPFANKRRVNHVARSRIEPNLLELGISIGIIDSDKAEGIIEIGNKKTLENYKEDMEKIIEMTEERKIPIFLVTVVSNLKIPPTGFSYGLDNETANKRYESLKKNGEKYLEDGEYKKALQRLKKAEDLDCSNPKLFYQIGLVYEELGEYEKALRYLTKAKDKDDFSYDVRAKSELNDYLRSINESHVHIIDLEKKLKGSEERYLLQDNFFGDYVHYSESSNPIVARKIFEGMSDNKSNLLT